jgi:hypothetical protein
VAGGDGNGGRISDALRDRSGDSVERTCGTRPLEEVRGEAHHMRCVVEDEVSFCFGRGAMAAFEQHLNRLRHPSPKRVTRTAMASSKRIDDEAPS